MKRPDWLTPRPLPLRDYLSVNMIIAALIELVQGAVIAGLAISRANGHRLPATTAAVFLAVGPVIGATFGTTLAYFSALSETVGGLVLRDGIESISPPKGDPLAPRSLWRRALRAALVAGIWGAGLGVMVVAILNRRQAGFVVLFVGFVVAAGVASTIAGVSARTEAVRTVLGRPLAAIARSARRRAWRDLALPVGLLAGVVNASFTWVLFHDYTVGTQFGTHVLTERQVLADIPVLILINVFVAVFICGRAGRAEAAMGLVTFEDPAVQLPDAKTAFGVQAVVYSIAAVILLSILVRFVLPALPNLAEAMIARGFLAGTVAFLIGGFSYIRGAANVTAGATAVIRSAVQPTAGAST